MSVIKGYMNGVAIYERSARNNEDNLAEDNLAKKNRRDVYGVPYQCVEFARRYYIQKFHVTFPDVDNAYDLFDLKYATDLRTKKRIRLHAIPNSSAMPEPGDMIIWKPEGRYATTGHVAIMKQIVNRSTVTIMEQNGNTNNGQRNIRIHHSGILGWMHLSDNQR